MLLAELTDQALQLEVGGVNNSLVSLAMILALLWYVGMALTFKKANQPWWAAIIPYYNFYVMLKIGGNPPWWILLLLVPVLNLYIFYRMFVDVSKAFGQGIAFGLGLLIPPFTPICWLWLGLGSFNYQGSPA